MKLVSLNIERAKHLDRILAFLQKERPDVACLQEVFQPDLADFAQRLGLGYVFAPMVLMGRAQPEEPPFVPFGIGMLSRFPIKNVQRRYYDGEETVASKAIFNGIPDAYAHPLLSARFQTDGEQLTLATTHFSWTPDGKPNDTQRKHLQALLKLLEGFDDFVLCGDFNTPRGGEIFTELAKRYKDNIPPHYQTSIDGSLHRAGPLQLMIDGLFSTPHYEVSNVRLQDGVSDHCAILATVRKKASVL